MNPNGATRSSAPAALIAARVLLAFQAILLIASAWIFFVLAPGFAMLSDGPPSASLQLVTTLLLVGSIIVGPALFALGFVRRRWSAVAVAVCELAFLGIEMALVVRAGQLSFLITTPTIINLILPLAILILLFQPPTVRRYFGFGRTRILKRPGDLGGSGVSRV